VAQFVFDGARMLISVKDPAGNVTNLSRDADGRVTQMTHPDGSSDSVAFDARGSIASLTGATGKATQYTYDRLGRLVSVTDALGQTIKYGYDELGNRVSVTDGNNHVTLFQYDQRGRRTGRTLPGGQSETFAYNAAGEMIAHTDFNGKTTTYQHDSVGRLLSKTPDASFGAPPVSYAYTATGRRASMTDGSGTTTYIYDALSRLTAKQSPAGNLTYGYDSAGNLTTMQAGTLSVAFAYDSMNRLSSVTEPATGTTNYSYDLAGNLQSMTYPNGLVYGYSYDSVRRLKAMSLNQNGIPGASYSYTLDPTGHRLAVSELGGRTVNYTYDGIYRLTGESIAGAGSGPNGTVGYTYDAIGNRTGTTSTLAGISSGTFSYDADDRLSDDVYDANGNTVTSGGIGNLYDFENRLTQHGSASMVYDGDGNRVSETAGGITTKYLIDDQNLTGFPQVVAETSSDGSTRAFVYGLSRVSQMQATPSGNGSATSFYVYDGRGSVRALANPSGATTDTYDYDAFGNLIHRTGTTANNLLFAGEQFDPALGLYYNRARYYDERRGRFWTMDTHGARAGDSQSLNKYLYTRADPVNRRDPSGNEEDLIGEAVTVEIQGDLAVANTVTPSVGIANTVSSVAAADTVAISSAGTAGTAGGAVGSGAAGSIGPGVILTGALPVTPYVFTATDLAVGLLYQLESLFDLAAEAEALELAEATAAFEEALSLMTEF
jgi:RHS repeat-associated protein